MRCAQVQRLQDLEADLDLLDRRRGQRDPDGVADALRQQRAERDRDLIVPWNAGPASVTPRCSGQSPRLGQQLVGAHHDDRVVVLDRDLEVVEVVLLEQRRPPRPRTRPAPPASPCRTSRSSRGSSEPALTPIRIDVPWSLAARGDLLDLVVELADVAGVHAGRRHSRPRSRRRRTSAGSGCRRSPGSASAARSPAARRRRPGSGRPTRTMSQPAAVELGDLLQRRVDVGGQRRRHRLHRDRGVAARRRTLPTLIWRVLRRGASTGGGSVGHAQVDAGHAVHLGVSSWSSLESVEVTRAGSG